MATLTQRLLRYSRTLRPSLREPIAWGRVLGVATTLGALEVCGRFAPNDFVDAFGVGGLVLVASVLWARRTRRTRARCRLGLARVQRWLGPRIPRLGLDLRGEPRLEVEIPPLFAACLLLTSLFALCVEGSLELLPTAGREWLRGVSGILYLSLLSALWALLITGTFFFFAVPLAYLDAWLDSSRHWRPRRPRLVPPVGMAAFLGLGAAAQWLPISWALGILGGSYLLFAGVVMSCPYSQVRLAWSSRATPQRLRSLPWRATNVLGGLWFAVLVASVSALATGERWSGPGSDETVLTAVLGLAFTWTACVATAWFFCLQAFEVLVNTLHDPARPAPLRVRVRELPRAERRAVRELLGGLSMRAVFSETRGKPDAELVWRPDSIAGIPDSYPPPPAWPRPLGPRDSVSPQAIAELGRALRRRAQLVHRRQIRKGLEQALKEARSRSFDSGSGFWIGPHLWFLYHVTRDTDEDSQWFLGSPYRRLIPRAARHHLHQVLRAVQIDLFYLEDGIGHRRFQRVLAQLFEFYDLFGERPLEERHFKGLPGVRVWVHEMPEPPSPADNLVDYPEPDYAEIGRARILHVFKDRGGDEQLEFLPSDSSSFPAPHELAPL